MKNKIVAYAFTGIFVFLGIRSDLVYADFNSSRAAQQQAYADYFNAVSQLTTPSQDQIKNLRSQILAPANQALTKAQQAEQSAAFPTPPVPPGTNKRLSGAALEKLKESRKKKLEKVLAKVRSKNKGKKMIGARQTGQSLPNNSGPSKTETQVQGHFAKEIEFHHHTKDDPNQDSN